MPNFKFFNIGQANAEIERLETENKNVVQQMTVLQDNAAAVEKRAVQLEADLATAKQTLSTVQTAFDKRAVEFATVVKERDEALATIAKPDGEIARQASIKAVAITAAQGQPPIAAAPVVNPAIPTVPALTGLIKVEAAFKAGLANHQ